MMVPHPVADGAGVRGDPFGTQRGPRTERIVAEIPRSKGVAGDSDEEPGAEAIDPEAMPPP